jgi:predicted RNase H-like nuclease (RuvC/YqgF family)
MSSIGILFIVGISLNPNYYIIAGTMYSLMLASCFYPNEIKKEEEQEEEQDEEDEDEDEFEEYQKKLKEIEGEVDILSSRLDKVGNEFNKMIDNLSISEENEKP